MSSSDDHARVTETAHVGALLFDADSARWRAHARVDKWDPEQTARVFARIGRQLCAADFERLRVAPYETLDAPGNLLTTAGLGRITSLIIGGGGQAATNTAARLGAGDSATAAAVGDTDLGAVAGSTHRWFQIMDATYPQAGAGVLTFKATFGTADGNFAWAEWGVDIGTPTVASGNTVNAVLLNHRIQSLGTKVAGATWALTTTITIS